MTDLTKVYTPTHQPPPAEHGNPNHPRGPQMQTNNNVRPESLAWKNNDRICKYGNNAPNAIL